MKQIKMTAQGVLSHFKCHTENHLESMDSATLRSHLIEQVGNFSKDTVDPKIKDTDLIGVAAVIIYLLKSGTMSNLELKNTRQGEQRIALINKINSYTNIAIHQLELLTNQQLVQQALIWYTNIEMTMMGLLDNFQPYTKNAMSKNTAEELRQYVIKEICQHSLQQPADFPATVSDDFLIGKLAIIVFLIRFGKTPADLKALTNAQQRTMLQDETYFRTGIPYQFLASSVPADWGYQFIAPMSDQELVKLSLAWFVIDKDYARYHEITRAMTHDSFTGDEEIVGGAPSKDQDRTVEEQLKSGIRTLRITVDSNGFLNHGGITVFGTIDELLKTISTFLDDPINQYEVITIVDESDSPDRLQENYEKAFGHKLFNPKSYSLGNGVLWPTIKEMTTATKIIAETGVEVNPDHHKTIIIPSHFHYPQQVVVFSNSEPNPNIPWRLYGYDGSGTDFLISADRDDYNWSNFDTDGIRPPMTEVQNPNKQRWNNTPNLYLLNRYFYESHANTSDKDYSKWEVGELLIEYTQMAWNMTNRKPNFIMVDYYDRFFNSDTNTNCLFDLIMAMNHPACWKPWFIQKEIMRRRPVTLTDADGVLLGNTYNIQSAARDENNAPLSLGRVITNIAGKTVVSIQMLPTNLNDVNQTWKIIYNGSQTGLALVNPSADIALFDPNAQSTSTESDTPMIGKEYSNGELGTGFAIKQHGNHYYIYKSNMQTKPYYDQSMSLLDVTGGGDTIKSGNAVARDNNNGGKNQLWSFISIGNEEFIPPTKPEMVPILLAGAQPLQTMPQDANLPFTIYSENSDPLEWLYFPGTGRVVFSANSDGTGDVYTNNYLEAGIGFTDETGVSSQTFENGKPLPPLELFQNAGLQNHGESKLGFNIMLQQTNMSQSYESTAYYAVWLA